MRFKCISDVRLKGTALCLQGLIQMPRLLRTLALLCLVLSANHAHAADSPETLLSRCGVSWDSPSRDAFDSMPLSGWRGAGANVWFSEGALRLYLAHSGAFDADDVLRKIGALTLSTPGVDFSKPRAFRQELELSKGSIRVELTAQDGTTLTYRLQFCGETLVVDAKSSRPIRLEVAYGSWRAKPTASAEDTVERIDGVLLATHRNRNSTRGGRLAAEQNVPEKLRVNPALNRVYGCAIDARGGMDWGKPRTVKASGWSGYEWPGQTVETTQHLLTVTIGAGQRVEPSAWLERSRLLLEPDALLAVRAAADLRWEEFWRRSYIFVQPGGKTNDPAFQVGRNYQLFRYMLACNQEGEVPLKFNGGIFTVEPHAHRIPARLNNAEVALPNGGDPDYRRWDNMFMGQNQRWLGWPGIAAGDPDLTETSLKFYRERLPVAQARALNLKANGAVYHEYLSLAGHIYDQGNARGTCNLEHLTYHFSMGLEHAWMAVQNHLVNGRSTKPHLPWIIAQLRFYDSFYRSRSLEKTGKELDTSGRLIIYPANGLELTAGATNPIETVAALRALTTALLELGVLENADREFVESLRSRLPELPTAERKGFTVLSPAKSWQKLLNGWELPELYAAWPYRLVGVTQPATLTLARVTWNLLDEPRGNNRQAICHKLDFSWQATWVNTAALGMAEEAKKRAIAKFSDTASACRFPAFFGPGHDWLPDHNWGGSGSVGLQEMLLAAEPDAKGKIYLLAAWPKDWDVSFRLCAPGKTLVTCDIEGGKITRLEVSPLSRRSDIVLPEGWSLPSQ